MTADDVANVFRGRTVVCAASGPSLTAEDLEAVRGLPLVVCNSTWRLAPWADVLVAMDTAWWRQYGSEVAQAFPGYRVGSTSQAVKFGATHSTYGAVFHTFGNSGAMAVAFLARGRAARVILLGYDAGAGPDGKLHWHPDHPKPLNNPQASINRWPQQFDRLAKHCKERGVQVINASRATKLRCWPRMTIEEALRTATSNGTSGSSTSEASGTRMPAAPPSVSATAPGLLATAAT